MKSQAKRVMKDILPVDLENNNYADMAYKKAIQRVYRSSSSVFYDNYIQHHSNNHVSNETNTTNEIKHRYGQKMKVY